MGKPMSIWEDWAYHGTLGYPEPTNNDVRRMLKYPDSSEESDDPNNSATDTADETNLTQAQKFVKASKNHCENENQMLMMTLVR